MFHVARIISSYAEKNDEKTKILLLLTIPGFLVVGCTPETTKDSSLLSTSSDNPQSSSSVSSEAKQGKITSAADLHKLLSDTIALPVSSLKYTYQEKMPNETGEFTIQNHYEVTSTKNENLVKQTQHGKDTPIVRYQGIVNNVYHQTETGTGFDSAVRKKIVNEVSNYDGEITLENATTAVQNNQKKTNLNYLFSDGETGSLAGKINFLNATGEKNTQVSFSSAVGDDGKETVHYVSYYEETSTELDDPTSYDYDFTAVIENNRVVSATLKGKMASIDSWDNEKHEPKEGVGTEMMFVLDEVNYVDALPETTNTPLLSDLSTYFITSIQHASFKDYMTGKDTIIRVGDAYFLSDLDIDAYEPSTALDKSTITVTASSDETVIGKDDYGSYKALKVGTTNLTLGNTFNPNLYTMENVRVLPAEPSVYGIKGIEDGATVELEVNESKTYDLDLSSWGPEGPWDLSGLSLSGGEGIISSSFQMTGTDTSNYGVSVTMTGLKVGEANVSLEGTYYSLSFKVKVSEVDHRSTLTVPETEGVTLTNITAGASKHDKGESVSFYADPKSGYAIDHVYLVQGENKTELTAGSQNLYTFTMPDGDCSLEFSVRKLEMAVVNYTKPSSTAVSEFKVYYNPEGSYEDKIINSGSQVAVGTKIQIKLSLNSGYTLKSISVSDGAEVTTVTANKQYSFILGSKDVTITLDIQAEASSHAITITKSNDYALESISADSKPMQGSQRSAKSGQTIKATIYAYNTSKSIASVTITDANGGDVAFTQKTTTIDDPDYDPDYDHGDPTQYNAMIVTFTMPDAAVTITATVA